MSEPSAADIRELEYLADMAWPHPTRERFMLLAKRCVPQLIAALAARDAQIEALRTAKPKREKVA